MRDLPEIKYGPIGDPDSTDNFEWLQARAPEGWHVEGQHLGYWWATSLHREHLRGYTKQELVDRMHDAGPRR